MPNDTSRKPQGSEAVMTTGDSSIKYSTPNARAGPSRIRTLSNSSNTSQTPLSPQDELARPSYPDPYDPYASTYGYASGRSSYTSAGPAPLPARASKIPSRHGNCELCALVEECKDVVARELSVVSDGTRMGGMQLNGRTVRGRKVLFHDESITVYEADDRERMTERGKHLIIVINIHAESVNELGPVDVPLLSHILDTSRAILASSDQRAVESGTKTVRVGIVGSLTRDSLAPSAHLHAHAFSGPIDTTAPGSTFWRRNVVFGSANWWGIEDLRAEIREESSNNRVKSGYDNRQNAPIDKVPGAGAVSGPANALER